MILNMPPSLALSKSRGFRVGNSKGFLGPLWYMWQDVYDSVGPRAALVGVLP